MRVFHTTDKETAQNILLDGFTDNEEEPGIRLDDRPINEVGLAGDTALELEIPQDLFNEYNCTAPGYWMISTARVPARIVNQYGPPKIYESEYTWVELELMKLGLYEDWVKAGRP